MSAPVSFVSGDAQPVNTESDGASSYHVSLYYYFTRLKAFQANQWLVR